MQEVVIVAATRTAIGIFQGALANISAVDLGRVVVQAGTLLHELLRRDGKKGLATLCIGGGQGAALLLERQ